METQKQSLKHVEYVRYGIKSFMEQNELSLRGLEDKLDSSIKKSTLGRYIGGNEEPHITYANVERLAQTIPLIDPYIYKILKLEDEFTDIYQAKGKEYVLLDGFISSLLKDPKARVAMGELLYGSSLAQFSDALYQELQELYPHNIDTVLDNPAQHAKAFAQEIMGSLLDEYKAGEITNE